MTASDRSKTNMLFDLLGSAGVIALVILTFAYPRVQEARERAAVERLQGNRDPAATLAEVERLQSEAQEEASFFRRIGSFFGPRPRL